MKKVSNIFLTAFGIGITLCLFAGTLAFVGFVAALLIGGEIATALCVFIHKSYFPWVIRFTSVFALSGLIGMYLSKVSSLTISSNQNEKQ